jgi:osmoprotectant transport system permease protein
MKSVCFFFSLKEHPEVKEILNSLAGILTDDKMRKLNYKVDSLKESPAKVATEFLQAEGLIK